MSKVYFITFGDFYTYVQLISASPEHADTLAADDSDVLTTAPDLSSQARVRKGATELQTGIA